MATRNSGPTYPLLNWEPFGATNRVSQPSNRSAIETAIEIQRRIGIYMSMVLWHSWDLPKQLEIVKSLRLGEAPSKRHKERARSKGSIKIGTLTS